MKIKVTQDHIDKGIRCDSIKCPIALAVKAVGISYAIIGTDCLYFKGDGSPITLSPKVIQFIGDFDSQHKVHPFEFEINEN